MARVEEDSMAPLGVSSSDRRRYAHARQQGKARLADRSRVLDARYDSVTDFIELKFTGSGSTSIPRSFVPGLARRSRSKMRSLAVSPAGDALSWPSLDIDVYVPGLLERAFGAGLFAVSTGRRGRRRSRAEATGAKSNGAKKADLEKGSRRRQTTQLALVRGWRKRRSVKRDG
jgi:hypothetical protein